MSYFLEGLAGCSRNERVPLTGTRMTIGRSIDSSIHIISPLVSRCHAVLMFGNNQWVIKDVKSINGVYVNNTKLPPEGTYILNDKDIISLGPPEKTQFRYCYSKCIADSDISTENERPCKIKKSEKYQSISDTCAEKDTGNLLSIENVVNHDDHLYIGAECTISTSSENEGLEPQTTGRKLVSPETDSTSDKNMCKNLADDTKATKCSTLTPKSINVAEGSLNEPDSENLRRTVESLRQLLAAKEKAQQDLEDQLLRAEAQLIEKQHEAEKKDNEIEGKCIQEKIKGEVLQQVGEIMEAELICGICTELFIEAITLNCAHTFCKFCIKKWKQKKKECPICRARIKTETQALVLDNFIEKMVENLSAEVKEHRKRLTEERHNTNTKSSGSSRSDNQEAYIVISDIESEDYDSDFNDSDSSVSDSSVEGMPWAYYGGYGRCYNCGRRGHWANGCPDM